MSDFTAVHARLRRIMIDAATHGIVTVDEPGKLVIRTAPDTPGGEQGWFGTVTIGKSYVAYHLMPLYADPGLAEGLSAALTRRRQGKTCFNFKTIDDDLFAELAVLTRTAAGAA